MNIDYHVEVADRLYSVPYQLVGQLLDERYTSKRAAAAPANPGLLGHRELLAGGTRPSGGQRPGRAPQLPGPRQLLLPLVEKGSTEWVEYAFEKPSRVREVEVYWFGDTGSGECRVPLSWRVLYKDGEEWKPVATPGPYGVEKDRYNRVSFEPVTTRGLRLEVVLPREWSSGILEWKVNRARALRSRPQEREARTRDQ